MGSLVFMRYKGWKHGGRFFNLVTLSIYIRLNIDIYQILMCPRNANLEKYLSISFFLPDSLIGASLRVTFRSD